MLRMRRGEDEWVDQTRELTIESPLVEKEPCGIANSCVPDEMEVTMRDDIQMVSTSVTGRKFGID